MTTYVFTDDYKADLHDHITQLFTSAKTLNTSRAERLRASDDLIEAYFEHTETTPDGNALERLATLILRDELTDTNRMKSRNTEYPILSDDQLERREDGEVKVDDVYTNNNRATGKKSTWWVDDNGGMRGGKQVIRDYPR